MVQELKQEVAGIGVTSGNQHGTQQRANTRNAVMWMVGDVVMHFGASGLPLCQTISSQLLA